MAGQRGRVMPRRKLVWARQTASGAPTTIATGQAAVFDLLATFRAANGGAVPLGSTVTRVRIDMATEYVNINGLVGCLTTGLIVDQALSAANPSTEVPEPDSEPHADWMYWRSFFRLPAGDGDLVGTASAVNVTYEIDVRSQRKMEELGESLFWVVKNSTAASHLVQVSASVLLKLP